MRTAISRLLLAARRRRLPRMVAIARRIYLADRAKLGAISWLTEEQRRVLAATMRRYDVIYAARWVGVNGCLLRLGRLLIYVGVYGACIVCLLGPVITLGTALMGRTTLAGDLLALAVYLTGFGIVSSGYFVWQNFLQTLRLALIATVPWALTALTTGLWVAFGPPQLGSWLAVRYGAEAVAGAVLLIILAHAAMTAGAALLRPLWLGRFGVVPPSMHVAAQLYLLLILTYDARSGWRQPAVRRQLINRMHGRTGWIARIIPRGLWLAGVRGSAHRDTLRHCRSAAAALSALRWRLLEANSQADYELVCHDIVIAATAVAGGDWQALNSNEITATRTRLVAFGRRLLPAGALLATALALPHLPGITVEGAALSSVRAGLIIAAVLSLVSAGNPSADQALGAFSDTTKGP
jgi:hypothetical protein